MPLLAAVLLAACGGQQDAAPDAGRAPSNGSAPAAVAPANQPTVTGQVSAGEITQLPKGIVLRARVLDVTDPSTPPVTVGETSVETRRLPLEFAVPYDPAKIAADRNYVVQAELVTEGVTLYSTQDPAPVLTQGAASRADLVLVRGSGPDTSISVSEQYRRDFDLLESQLGNMRRVVGERMTDDVTVGWDAFVDDTGVRFARESVDFADAGRATFRYAYRYTRPWIVARERGTTLTLVGWDADGNVVLNQHGKDGSISTEDAASLLARATEMQRIAGQNASRAR
jgi:putative lipoprotein